MTGLTTARELQVKTLPATLMHLDVRIGGMQIYEMKNGIDYRSLGAWSSWIPLFFRKFVQQPTPFQQLTILVLANNGHILGLAPGLPDQVLELSSLEVLDAPCVDSSKTNGRAVSILEYINAPRLKSLAVKHCVLLNEDLESIKRFLKMSKPKLENFRLESHDKCEPLNRYIVEPNMLNILLLVPDLKRLIIFLPDVLPDSFFFCFNLHSLNFVPELKDMTVTIKDRQDLKPLRLQPKEKTLVDMVKSRSSLETFCLTRFQGYVITGDAAESDGWRRQPKVGRLSWRRNYNTESSSFSLVQNLQAFGLFLYRWWNVSDR